MAANSYTTAEATKIVRTVDLWRQHFEIEIGIKDLDLGRFLESLDWVLTEHQDEVADEYRFKNRLVFSSGQV